MDIVGKEFKVKQNSSINKNRNLCEGKVTSFLGTKEGIDYYKAEITICFNPRNIHDVDGEIALDNGNVYLATKPGRMIDVTKDISWIDTMDSDRTSLT
jgi:hypothetical protein